MFLTVDWREIIYQMALDYYKYGHLDNFELMVRRANPDYYPTGKTGYEQYYIDIQGFWRQLYNPNIEEQIKDLTNSIDSLTQIKNSAENDYQVAINNNKPLSEVEAYKLSLETAEQNLSNAEKKLENLQKDKENYYYDTENDKLYWNKSVYEKPEALNFWFDFLDTEGLLSSFGVKSIGVRPKAINDTNIQSIYFRETPNILFVEDISNEDAKNTEYTYIQVPGILKMFSISSQGKSAKSKLDELLYNYGYYPQSATINCIPIYYLQPNTRIHINDKETNLIGDFIISKITIPLSYNGTMSLTATRAAEDLSIELIASSAVDNI